MLYYLTIHDLRLLTTVEELFLFIVFWLLFCLIYTEERRSYMYIVGYHQKSRHFFLVHVHCEEALHALTLRDALVLFHHLVGI